MPFPTDPLSTKVELQLDGVWTDVTGWTYTRDGITIRRGRQDETSSFSPGECRLTLNNRDGRFSPRNANGPYYGAIGRNTPLRVSVQVGGTSLVSRVSADRFTCPDSASLSITGDIDVRCDVRIPNWAGAAGSGLLQLVTKFQVIGQRSYILSMDSDCRLGLSWSTDGTNELLRRSTVPLPTTTGRQAVRATLDVDNGAGGHTATFYVAPTMAGPWAQFGDPVVNAGTTSIFDSTSILRSPSADQGVETYAIKVLQGIGGTERANPDFSAQAEGTTSFADAAGNTWTAAGAAAITNRGYRFHGEVSSWPQEWDVAQADVYTTVAASGVLRRLGQGAATLLGPIQRSAQRQPSVNGYWPLEDAAGSTSMASGLPGGPPMTLIGTPDFGADDTTFLASGPLPRMANSLMSGVALSAVATGTVHARFLMLVPAAGAANNSVLLRLFTTGTAPRWDLVYTTSTSGTLTLQTYDSLGTSLMSSGAAFRVDGKPLIVVVEMVQDGPDVDWKIITIGYTDDVGLQHTGTLAGQTVGAAHLVQLSPNQLLTDTVMGHLVLNSALPGDVESPLRGYAGETAGRRIARLCSEEGIAFTGYGDLDLTEPMGMQTPRSLPDLLAECEASDLGQLFESRDQLGLAYRTRQSRAVQSPFALSYGSLSELNPVEDDQGTRNDVTVSRIGGSSARATVDVGPLSTQPPPNGVGRYDDSVELSLASESQLANQANLRVTLGTIDEPRYPVIRVRLETPPFATSTALTTAAVDLDHGDLIVVSGTPAWLPPDEIRQHTVGQVETLSPYTYAIDYVCQPATPIGSAGVYGDTQTRWAADNSTLTSSITSTATGAAALSITTPPGEPLWTSDPTDFPFNVIIGGEEITLSAIAATASPQAATVSARSVNGVAKAHTAGAGVQIADVFYWAL